MRYTLLCLIGGAAVVPNVHHQAAPVFRCGGAFFLGRRRRRQGRQVVLELAHALGVDAVRGGQLVHLPRGEQVAPILHQSLKIGRVLRGGGGPHEEHGAGRPRAERERAALAPQPHGRQRVGLALHHLLGEDGRPGVEHVRQAHRRPAHRPRRRRHQLGGPHHRDHLVSPRRHRAARRLVQPPLRQPARRVEVQRVLPPRPHTPFLRVRGAGQGVHVRRAHLGFLRAGPGPRVEGELPPARVPAGAGHVEQAQHAGRIARRGVRVPDGERPPGPRGLRVLEERAEHGQRVVRGAEHAPAGQHQPAEQGRVVLPRAVRDVDGPAGDRARGPVQPAARAQRRLEHVPVLQAHEGHQQRVEGVEV
mmetsp:Transcript_9521/g.15016  ORF Transcript_9521/g.15016 Transcript_9521/m.15016 type:complete len:362 (+) Transcript_9521:566-1651(+)